MKATFMLSLACAATLMLSGCEPEDPSLNLRVNTPLLAQNNSHGVMKSEADVLTFSDETMVGTSTLHRLKNGISVKVKTTGLHPGWAYTLWAVIFNNPEHCTDGECGEDDLFNEAVQADVIFTTGHPAQNDPTTYAGHLNEGDVSGSINPIALGMPSVGLIDSKKAEIHFVVRCHGPVIPEFMPDMIHTFAGGCAGFPPELGAPGPNTCEDIQFAVHMPMM